MSDTNDWRVVVDDTGGPFTGWPSVISDEEDRTILHRAGFKQEFWDGPSLHEAMIIAQAVADFMNKAREEQSQGTSLMSQEIERLRTENAILRAQTEWRPISEAPRDETNVLVLLGNGEVFRSCYCDGWVAATDIGTVNPTHYKPLGPPPEDAA
jgi:hypothetical protein